MARMHPDDIEDYEEATEGEKRVFRVVFVAVPKQSHKFKKLSHLKRDEDKENV